MVLIYRYFFLGLSLTLVWLTFTGFRTACSYFMNQRCVYTERSGAALCLQKEGAAAIEWCKRYRVFEAENLRGTDEEAGGLLCGEGPSGELSCSLMATLCLVRIEQILSDRLVDPNSCQGQSWFHDVLTSPQITSPNRPIKDTEFSTRLLAVIVRFIQRVKLESQLQNILK